MTARLSGLLAMACASIALPPLAHAEQAEQCIAAHEQGLAAEREGRLVESVERFSTCQEAACPEVIRSACEEKHASVSAAVPKLAVTVTGATETATVRIDETVVTPGASLAVNPGRHNIEVESGGQTERRSVLLREGEGVRTVRIDFEARESPAPPPPPPVEEAAIHPATWVLVGLSAAGLVTFGVAAGLGLQQQTELEEKCRPFCAQADIDVMRTRYLVADVGLGVAIAGAAAAAIVGLVVRVEPATVSLGPSGVELALSLD